MALPAISVSEKPLLDRLVHSYQFSAAEMMVKGTYHSSSYTQRRGLVFRRF